MKHFFALFVVAALAGCAMSNTPSAGLDGSSPDGSLPDSAVLPDGAIPDSSAPDAGTPDAAVAMCPDNVAEVGSVAELVAHIPASWRSGFAASTHLSSPTLIATDDIVLTTADVPLPTEVMVPCDAPGCEISFSSTSAVATAGLEARISAGTHFRMRFSALQPVPSPVTYGHIAFSPPCGETCAAGFDMCAADGACYGSGFDFCSQCAPQDARICACIGEAEGDSCGYVPPGSDLGRSGTCMSGVCETEF